MLEAIESENLGQLIEIQLALDQQQKLPDLMKKFCTFLKRNKIYKSSNLYRFIPSENNSGDDLITKGTDHPEFNSVYAFDHTKIFNKSSLLPKEYLFNYGGKNCPYTCMIAVYDGDQFIDDGEHNFTFKDSGNKLKALTAVVYVMSSD